MISIKLSDQHHFTAFNITAGLKPVNVHSAGQTHGIEIQFMFPCGLNVIYKNCDFLAKYIIDFK